MKRIALPQDGLETIFGARDANLKFVESLFGVTLRTQGDELIVNGPPAGEAAARAHLRAAGGPAARGLHPLQRRREDRGAAAREDPQTNLRDYFLREAPGQPPASLTRRRVNPKSKNQRKYLDAIDKFDIVFGVGPAGTGKTYLAMAQAVQYLLAKKVSRVILARPAVEAGEKLGFLPGDLQEKVNPYLRPLYDALYDMMDTEKATRLVERGIIEVAPIAFMRGRTLNDAFVILDEAQNTTSEQMKMFLTRLGFGSKAVVTGDITQIDLPNPRASGMVEALRIVKDVEGIGFVYFDDTDVVRHKLVQLIVRLHALRYGVQPGGMGDRPLSVSEGSRRGWRRADAPWSRPGSRTWRPRGPAGA